MADDYGAPQLIGEITAQRVPQGAVALWWLGQASFALKGAGITIYIDPYLAVSDRRLSPAAFAPEAVTNADVVILTHDHGDHVDPKALPGIAKASPRARFVAPSPVVAKVAELVGGSERVIAARSDEPIRLEANGGSVELLPVPAKHEELDKVGDEYPYLGYSVRLNGVCVHHAGDTIPYDDRYRLLRQRRIAWATQARKDRPFREFRDAVTRASARAEVSALATLRTAVSSAKRPVVVPVGNGKSEVVLVDDHEARAKVAVEFLKRRFPDRWTDRQRIDTTSKVTVNDERFDTSGMTPEQIAELDEHLIALQAANLLSE